MPLGIRIINSAINVGDTSELYAQLIVDGTPVTPGQIEKVEFKVQTPDMEIHGPNPGTILSDGRAYYQWKETTQIGDYHAQVIFTLKETKEIRSMLIDFSVKSPFDKKQSEKTPEEIIAEEVWMRLEDCFDSDEGGPFLRDWTLAHFDLKKIERYIPEVLLDINVQMPPTNATAADFTAVPNESQKSEILPIMAKGVLCKVIQHLVRSYAEQPIPQGAQTVYEDRTRYSSEWMKIYESEYKDYITMVRLWKRGFLNLGHSALLAFSKAGRLYYGGILRTRNIGRGFY